MYLKTLQLRGFKSFASATTLEFEPGITCVVGPNGSGKSNVVDALSWVMGEQGVKTLRGGKMEDVIFAGTTSRPALGRAEVSLTIDNSDGALDIDYTEVTLTRTLFRNGGSEYAINGAQCRLLDIQDLLSDTGLGREMHVIVGQGQLDAVLRATPAERRGFIEEAAGVLKHRKRKEKALRKLDGMQGNLLRLQDLLTEIRRQLGPLARQAKAAQRAHTLAAAVRDSGLRLLGDDLENATHELRTFLEVTAERKAQLRRGEEELQSIEATLAQREHGAAVANPQLSGAQVALTSLQSQREQLRNLHTLATERLRHLGSASHEEIIDLSALRDQLERLEVTAHEGKAQVEQARIQAANSAQAKAAGEQVLRVANQALAKYDQAALKHRELIASLSNQTSAHRSTTDALGQEIERLQAEHNEAKERYSAAQLALGSEGSEVDPLLDSEELESRAVLESLTAQLSGARGRLGAAQKIHATTNSQLAGAVARAQALEMSLQHGHGDQAVLTEISGVAGQVLGMFNAPEHLQPALTAALGTLGSAVLTPNQETALKVANSPQAQELGTTTVIHAVPQRPVWDRSVLERAVEQLNDPGAALLLDHIDLAKAGIPNDQEWLSRTLEQLLHKVVVVGTVAAATRLVALAPGAVGVTLDGRVVTHGQVRRWIPKETGPLRLRSELAAASQDIADRTQQLAKLSAEVTERSQEIAALQNLLANAQAAFEKVQERNRALAQKQVRTQAVLDNARQEVGRAAAKITGAQTRLDHGQRELRAAAQKLGQAKDDVTGDPAQRSGLEAAVHAAEEKLGILRDQELEVRVALRGCQEQFAAHTQRVSATQRNLANQERAVHRVKLANERRAITAQRAQSVQSESDLARGLIEISIATAKENLDQALRRQQARDHEIGQLRTRSTQLHQLVRSHIDIVHKDDLKQATLAQQVSNLEARAVEQYAMAPGDVVAQFGRHVPIELIDDNHDEPQLVTYQRSEQEEIFAQATSKLGNLGKINPLALEEFTALEERHEFLSTQLTDLTSTRADLLSLVTDIDNRVDQAFAHAFEDTAVQFEKVFGRLFPGGQGKLVLEDPDSPLTTGIEVEARPAGKQVKRLSLLSGGERSLTAIAFLVAIFLARPSPFYVMDEVEAALDDVNLGRLLAVFEELRESSQLIVITHQKRTMGIADALYGVTMAGDGISTVISQRLEPKSA